MVNLWVWRKFVAPISVTLGQGHLATEAGQNLSCPHDKVRTVHPIATKLSRYPPCHAFHQIKLWKNSIKNFLANYFCKISNLFSPNRIFYLPYLRNGWSNWWNKGDMSQLLVCWLRRLWPWPLTLNFQSQIISRKRKARLTWNERAGSR